MTEELPEQQPEDEPAADADSPASEDGDGRKPPPDDLTQDPAYEPPDDELKGIKGG